MNEFKEFHIDLAFIVVAILLLLIVPTCAHTQEPVTVDLEIIKQIESGGDPHAYNKRSGATGLYQITPICLEDFNRFSHLRPSHKGILYDLAMEAMYKPIWNLTVADWYITERIPQLLKNYGIEDTLDHRLIAYNWGAKKLRNYLRGEGKLPKETRNYIKKYYKERK